MLKQELAALRKKLGVTRLHAAELGIHQMGEVIDSLLGLPEEVRIRFDVWQVVKRDHASISFFLKCLNRLIKAVAKL